MASTKITLSAVHRPNVLVTTVPDGEIDPYWATLLAETFHGVVEGSTVGARQRRLPRGTGRR